MLDRATANGISEEDSVALLLLTKRNEFSNTRDYLRYFFPRHTTVRSIEEAGRVAQDVDFLFLVAEADTDRAHLPPWVDPATMTTISYVRKLDVHEVVVWAGLPLPG